MSISHGIFYEKTDGTQFIPLLFELAKVKALKFSYHTQLISLTWFVLLCDGKEEDEREKLAECHQPTVVESFIKKSWVSPTVSKEEHPMSLRTLQNLLRKNTIFWKIYEKFSSKLGGKLFAIRSEYLTFSKENTYS